MQVQRRSAHGSEATSCRTRWTVGIRADSSSKTRTSSCLSSKGNNARRSGSAYRSRALWWHRGSTGHYCPWFLRRRRRYWRRTTITRTLRSGRTIPTEGRTKGRTRAAPPAYWSTSRDGDACAAVSVEGEDAVPGEGAVP
ncbi:hypothetical protein MTO96_013394 [Rhipicephalus appendiculatus]